MLFNVLLLILLVFSSQVQAEIYKCVVDGKTVFSDFPCSDTAKKIMLKIRGAEKGEIESSKNRTRLIKISSLNYKIKKSEKEIEKLNSLMDEEVERFEKANSADSFWTFYFSEYKTNNSVNSEVAAAIEIYKIKIRREEETIKQCREQIKIINDSKL